MPQVGSSPPHRTFPPTRISRCLVPYQGCYCVLVMGNDAVFDALIAAASIAADSNAAASIAADSNAAASIAAASIAADSIAAACLRY